MNRELLNEVMPRLIADFDLKDRGKTFLQQGVCPSCGKKELYTSKESPWVVRCGRLNKCGEEWHIKELYPDLFTSWSDRHTPTPENPHKAADAYMRDGRGFDLTAIAGWYVQGSYYCGQRDIGTATVKFALPEGAYWERFIDNPQRFGKMKANFVGGYQGQWWQPPSLKIDAPEIWLTEGIFDAIALLHHDIQAVSLMSCNNYPTKALASLAEQLKYVPKKHWPILVFALDDGPAGEKFTKKFVKRAREEGWEATAAQPPKNRAKFDWNELHQRDRLSPEQIDEYRYLGKLLIARNPTEKALLIHRKTGLKDFPYGFDNRLYWFKMDLDRFMKAHAQVLEEAEQNDEQLTDDEIREKALTEAGSVNEIAACFPKALYYQANELTDESWYYFRVSFPHDGAAVKNTFTGSQLSGAGEFKKRLMGIAPGAVFTGSSAQLDRLMKAQLYNIKRVKTVDFVGYSKEHGAYVFGDVAVKDGRLVRLNEEDFFDLGKLSIKSLNGSVNLHLNPEFKEMNKQWPRLLWQAFGAKGLVALAFWFGSFFAEQIRERQKSFPFIEIVGEPGTGKTTLIEFMWKLCGRRDYEGFDPSKSTLAARARNFAQVANLPVVLTEGDRGDKDAKQRGFDWDELKTAYNGRSVRARGLKNSGNETYEPPFRGAIVIAQNAEVSASEAVLQRIIHLFTDKASQTQATKAAAEALERMPTESVSGFLLQCAMSEKEVLTTFHEKTGHYEKQLEKNPGLKNIRIIKNHAQLMALVDCLGLVTQFNEEQLHATRIELESMALERQKAVSADHPTVQEFWDVVDYLDNLYDEPMVNHSMDDDYLAINLNHFSQVAIEHKQNIPPLAELKKLLKASRHKKFIDIKTVKSCIHQRMNRVNPNHPKPASVKCWVFQKER